MTYPWSVSWKPPRIDGVALLVFVLVVVGVGVYVLQAGHLTSTDAASSPTSPTASLDPTALPTSVVGSATPTPDPSVTRSSSPPSTSPTKAAPSGKPSTTPTPTSQPPIDGIPSAGEIATLLRSVEDLHGLWSQPPAPPTTFRVGTLNVLGAIHTDRGGNKPGYASGATRAVWAAQLIRGAGLDVVGLQEFEAPQFQAFQRVAGGAYDVYPGLSAGHKPVQNSIAWRSDTWSLQESHLLGVAYFHGNTMPMPYIKLQNRQTGQNVWFMNIHNPANTHGPAERFRAHDIAIEGALVRRLHADGTPVVFTGDFNDRMQAFCPLTTRTPLRAANGGDSSGGCRLPADAGIDWIFATPEIQMTDYVRQRAGLVLKTTDHPFVHATATINGTTP